MHPISEEIDMKWLKFSEVRPAFEGLYRWRVQHRKGEFVVEFTDKMRWRGAGYTRVMSPQFDYWDGYRVHVPEGIEWSLLGEGENDGLAVVGLASGPCRACGSTPNLRGWQRTYNGGLIVCAEPHNYNSWRLNCCGWGGSPYYDDPVALISRWNEIHCTRARRAA